MLTIRELYHLDGLMAAPLFEGKTYPWEVLDGIGDFIRALGPTLSPEEYDHPRETVWIAKNAKIAPTAFIGENCIIGPDTEVRHCAFIRENAFVGDHCVVGNSTELKNVVLLSHVQTPHYNYVGDSVLGSWSHMGAGSITSNVKSDSTPIVIHDGEEAMKTGRKKIGAMLGDHVEIGCGSVLNPGTVIGAGSSVYPLSSVRGTIPAGRIYKQASEIALRRP